MVRAMEGLLFLLCMENKNSSMLQSIKNALFKKECDCEDIPQLWAHLLQILCLLGGSSPMNRNAPWIYLSGIT